MTSNLRVNKEGKQAKAKAKAKAKAYYAVFLVKVDKLYSSSHALHTLAKMENHRKSLKSWFLSLI